MDEVSDAPVIGKMPSRSRAQQGCLGSLDETLSVSNIVATRWRIRSPLVRQSARSLWLLPTKTRCRPPILLVLMPWNPSRAGLAPPFRHPRPGTAVLSRVPIRSRCSRHRRNTSGEMIAELFATFNYKSPSRSLATIPASKKPPSWRIIRAATLKSSPLRKRIR
jgi:hypothetical protein